MKKPILKKLLSASMLLVALVLLDACYPQGAEFVDELDLVVTVYDEDYDFDAPTKYTINDEIPLIGSDPEEIEFVDPITAAVIINEIKAQMELRGYELVDTDPDLYMPVAALKVKNTYIGCGGGGWWGYYPGWGYPGGCWYPVGYSYTTGTIFITLWDKDSVPDGDNDATPPEWEVGINGLIQGSQSTINSRIEKTIDQAFEQSPYIKTN